MIRYEPTKRGDQVKVTFMLPARDGNARVALVGDFNGWRSGANMFKRRGDLDVATVTLSTGRRYEFRYVDDDGTWFNDSDAHGYAPNAYGGQNSILDLRHNFEATDPGAANGGDPPPD